MVYQLRDDLDLVFYGESGFTIVGLRLLDRCFGTCGFFILFICVKSVIIVVLVLVLYLFDCHTGLPQGKCCLIRFS